MVLVGAGFERPDLVKSMLDPKLVPKKPKYLMAPPEFLIFAGVEFKDKIDWVGPMKEKAV